MFAAFTDRPLILAGLVAGTVLTVAYSARFLWGAFADRPGWRRCRPAGSPGRC
ncbi:hypothetical protein GCM10027614_67630 [Micromonospora vulcania]